MQSWWSLVVLVGLVGCNDRGLESGSSPNAPAVQSADVCLTDGSFDFHVSGAGWTMWNGKSVVAAVIENQGDVPNPDGTTASPRLPVRLGTTIADGAFSIMCPTSLRENYAYPSFALFVDQDGDGRCGAGDVGVESQRYGWDAAVEEHLAPYGEEQFQAVAGLNAPIGGGGPTFCQDYFP